MRLALTLFAAFTLSAPLAHATDEATPSTVQVQVPRSEFYKASSKEDTTRPGDSSPAGRVAIFASSYAPSSLSPEGSPSGVQSYRLASVPTLSASWIMPRRIGLELGGSLSALERKGASLSGPATQSAYLGSISIGARWQPFDTSVKPYAGAALLPSALFVAQSRLEEGSELYGLPMQATLGLTAPIGWMGTSLDAGLVLVRGNVGSGSASGAGARVGLAMEL